MTETAQPVKTPTPAAAAARTVCGWCNRILSTERHAGAVRHVTCDDCRGVASRLTQQVVAAGQRSGR